MKLDRFINRPVLSTVISILIVILGLIGLATLPITQYPDIAPPTVSVRANGVELCHCAAGRPNQRCGEHDVHDFQCIQ